MVIGILLIWLVAFSFWYKNQQKKKAPPPQKSGTDNYYIKLHQAKLRHDAYYNEYLAWCNQHSQIPMNKQYFIKSIEDKEKEIENLYKK